MPQMQISAPLGPGFHIAADVPDQTPGADQRTDGGRQATERQNAHVSLSASDVAERESASDGPPEEPPFPGMPPAAVQRPAEPTEPTLPYDPLWHTIDHTPLIPGPAAAMIVRGACFWCPPGKSSRAAGPGTQRRAA